MSDWREHFNARVARLVTYETSLRARGFKPYERSDYGHMIKLKALESYRDEKYQELEAEGFSPGTEAFGREFTERCRKTEMAWLMSDEAQHYIIGACDSVREVWA